MVKSEPDGVSDGSPAGGRAGGHTDWLSLKKKKKKSTTSVFPQEVDVINIALVLPVFSSAVVKATCVWVWCVSGNGKGGGRGLRWVAGWGWSFAVLAPQPWWADVMPGSGLGFMLRFGSC